MLTQIQKNSLKAMEIAVDNLSEYGVSNADRQNLKDILNTIIVDGKSPDCFWNYLGCGSFKECYELDFPNWVIKFCSEENRTDAEMYILESAEKAGVDNFFLPTFVFEIPDIPSEYLEMTEDYPAGFDFESEYDPADYVRPLNLNCAMIQMKCTTLIEAHEDFDMWYMSPQHLEKYNAAPIADLTLAQLIDVDLQYEKWVRRAAEVYGEQAIVHLVDFLDNHAIGDLHEGNIGYAKDGKPVILDWLSGDM